MLLLHLEEFRRSECWCFAFLERSGGLYNRFIWIINKAANTLKRKWRRKEGKNPCELMIDEVAFFDFKDLACQFQGPALAPFSHCGPSVVGWSMWPDSVVTGSLPLLLPPKTPNNATFNPSGATSQWPFYPPFSGFTPCPSFLALVFY